MYILHVISVCLHLHNEQLTIFLICISNVLTGFILNTLILQFNGNLCVLVYSNKTFKVTEYVILGDIGP